MLSDTMCGSYDRHYAAYQVEMEPGGVYWTIRTMQKIIWTAFGAYLFLYALERTANHVYR